MQKVVLDTDLLSELLKQANPVVAARAYSYQQIYLAITLTSFSALEILSGLRHIQAHAQLKRAELLFLRNEEIVPEAEDYRLASEIIGSMWRLGTPIGLVDPMIAACAIRRGYGVATGNTNHYQFIRNAGYDFPLENWRNP